MDVATRPKPPDTQAVMPLGVVAPPRPPRFRLSPINKRRWENFKTNRRGYWSLWLFSVPWRHNAPR